MCKKIAGYHEENIHKIRFIDTHGMFAPGNIQHIYRIENEAVIPDHSKHGNTFYNVYLIKSCPVLHIYISKLLCSCNYDTCSIILFFKSGFIMFNMFLHSVRKCRYTLKVNICNPFLPFFPNTCNIS